MDYLLTYKSRFLSAPPISPFYYATHNLVLSECEDGCTVIGVDVRFDETLMGLKDAYVD